MYYKDDHCACDKKEKYEREEKIICKCRKEEECKPQPKPICKPVTECRPVCKPACECNTVYKPFCEAPKKEEKFQCECKKDYCDLKEKDKHDMVDSYFFETDLYDKK